MRRIGNASCNPNVFNKSKLNDETYWVVYYTVSDGFGLQH